MCVRMQAAAVVSYTDPSRPGGGVVVCVAIRDVSFKTLIETRCSGGASCGQALSFVLNAFSLERFILKLNTNIAPAQFSFSDGAGEDCRNVAPGFEFDLVDLRLFEGQPFEFRIVRARFQAGTDGVLIEGAMDSFFLGPLEFTRPETVSCPNLSLLPSTGPAFLLAATLARQEFAVSARVSLLGSSSEIW